MLGDYTLCFSQHPFAEVTTKRLPGGHLALEVEGGRVMGTCETVWSGSSASCGKHSLFC